MVTRNVLKGIAVGLALLVTTLLVLYLNRSDPYGPLPGKRLQGEEVTGTIMTGVSPSSTAGRPMRCDPPTPIRSTPDSYFTMRSCIYPPGRDLKATGSSF